jgi:hypothetical protein
LWRTSSATWQPGPDLARSGLRSDRFRDLDLLDGQYNDPFGVFAFNPVGGWSRDASEDVAKELRKRCDSQLRDVHPTALPSWFHIVVLIRAVNAGAIIKRLPAGAADDHSAYRF